MCVLFIFFCVVCLLFYLISIINANRIIRVSVHGGLNLKLKQTRDEKETKTKTHIQTEREEEKNDKTRLKSKT